MTEGAQMTGARYRNAGLPLFFLIASVWLLWCLRATVLYFIDELVVDGPPRNIYSNSVKFIVWVIPAGIYLWTAGERDLLAAFHLTTPVRRILSAAALCLIYLGATLIAGLAIEGKTWIGPLTVAGALTRFASVAFSPVSEELLFRGFLLPSLNSHFAFWKANTITAVIFSSMHWPFWLWHNGPSLAVLQSSILVFVIALFLGWLLRLTGSVWPPIAMHIANNYMVSFLVR